MLKPDNMARKQRRSHSAAFKAEVALEAIKEERSLVDISKHFGVHTNLVSLWKKTLVKRASEIFDKERLADDPGIEELHARIVRLAMEKDILVQRAREHSLTRRKGMLNREHQVPILRQCIMLGISRSSAYYVPVPVSDRDRELMRLMEEIHLEDATLGSRGISGQLRMRGHDVGRFHVRTLMKKMGITAIRKKSPPG